MPGLFYAAQAVPEVNHGPRGQPASARADPHSAPHSSNATATESYIGSTACSRCHADIYDRFARTAMGRSMSPVTPEFLKSVPVSGEIYDAKLDRHFEVTGRDGKLYQSEYRLDASGREVFRDTHPIQWIIGAGVNGFGGLIQRGDYLFEAPLSYYPSTGKWDLSPGYQRGDYGFNRVVASGCIFCHSGRPQPAPEIIGKYLNPPFAQLAIGCENCHGPGSAHVEAMNGGESYQHGKDPTVVNPGSLTPALSNDICMSCHQTGDTRVFQPGKTYLDFRPGTPLDRVMAILMTPPTRDNPPSEDHVQHYFSMIMSKCYRATQAAGNPMRCITCHDPHMEPSKAEAPAYFNGKCMGCHTAQSCKSPAEARKAVTPADNCIGCHMPKRDNAAISHSAITNHRILAKPDEPFPEIAFQQTTEDLPDLIYLNRAPGDKFPLSQLSLLKAYDQLRGQKSEYAASYLSLLAELEKSHPGDAQVQAALGARDLKDGTLEDAAGHLQDSLRLDPIQPSLYAQLADIAAKKGQAQGAVTLGEKAVTLDPYNPDIRKALVLHLIEAKQYEEAEAAMERYLEDFPQDGFMRKMLAIAKSN